MTGWRATHNLVATLTLLGAVSGMWLLRPMGRMASALLAEAHIWGSLALMPGVVWMLWRGRKIWFRLVDTRTPAKAFNRWLARTVLLTLVAILASGLWIWLTERPIARITALTIHRACTEALLPALGLHVLLGFLLRGARREA